MNKKKVIISCVLLVVLFLWLDYDYAFQFLRKVTIGLEVKEVTLGTGVYNGAIDIASGYYDVISDGDNYLDTIMLRKGNTCKYFYIEEDQRFVVQGSGKLRFVPTSYEKLECKDDTYQILDSGFYKIGTCIEAGSYEVTMKSQSNSNIIDFPFILIYGKENTQFVDPIQIYSFDKKNQELTCQLNQDEVALIYRGDYGNDKTASLQFKKIK